MENENLTNEVETEETEAQETEAQQADNFDALWNDDDDWTPGNADEEADAQPEESEAEAETEEESETTEEPEPEQKPETDNQRFKLKVNGEELEVGRDEIIELAQKGKDYDRVKEERDKFKTDSETMNRLKTQESFLKELAESSNLTVEQLMENTRARMLMAKDENLTEEEALKKVREEASKAEKKEEQKAEASPEERRQQMFAAFLAAYPNVKAEEIPQEVWADAGRTFDLVGAYQRHENRLLREEVKALRQNNRNKERSVGSTRSAGTRNRSQAFDALWYDDDD